MKKLIFVLSLVSTIACAQGVVYTEKVQFGDRPVTLRISDAYSRNLPKLVPLIKKSEAETDPFKREERYNERFELGDPEVLFAIADLHERRGDFVGAYAFMYASHKFAQFSARYNRPDPEIRGPQFAMIAKQLARLDKSLTATQRKAAIAQAADLFLNNPNCCTAM